MNKQALLHRAKSEYAYATDEKTLNITIRTARNDLKSVSLIYGNPFMWSKDAHWQYKIEPMNKRYQTSVFDYYFLEIKPQDYRVKYAFILEDFDGAKYFYGSKKMITLETIDNSLDLQNLFNYPYINHEDLAKTPSWVKDTVWYQIFPDRFYTEKSLLPWGKLPVRNNEIYGGNIQGIIDKIPYLSDLGITGIYFTPIFEAKTAHKYDTIDYYKIDPSFGTNADFKKLVKIAHKHNIKVMLDGVFNHSGYLHPYFLDVVKNGENSIYKDCFYIDRFPVVNFPLTETGEPKINGSYSLNFRTFAYTPHMPKWNTDNPLTKKHLLGVIKYWIKNYNIDGWRLDVSNEVSHDFLREIKKASRKANPNTFILGENWDQSLAWLQGDQLDSVMNYDLSYPIWQYFEHIINTNEFIDIINTYLALTPKHAMENMFNLLDCHDTIRILRRLNDNVDRTKLAYLFMFLSAGAPNIYYGGEIGLTGDNDPDNRRCMIWDSSQQNMDLYNFIKRLISLRSSYQAFKESDYQFVQTGNDLLVFTKESANETVLCVINNSENTKDFEIPSVLKGNYIDLFNNNSSSYDKIHLEPYKFILLYKEE
ncbi:MAG: alpha-glycosidase [Acholeplasma sp.]|nr:alpha-glycosidase [Acholeplasma sp.]